MPPIFCPQIPPPAHLTFALPVNCHPSRPRRPNSAAAACYYSFAPGAHVQLCARLSGAISRNVKIAARRAVVPSQYTFPFPFYPMHADALHCTHNLNCRRRAPATRRVSARLDPTPSPPPPPVFAPRSQVSTEHPVRWCSPLYRRHRALDVGLFLFALSIPLLLERKPRCTARMNARCAALSYRAVFPLRCVSVGTAALMHATMLSVCVHCRLRDAPLPSRRAPGCRYAFGRLARYARITGMRGGVHA